MATDKEKLACTPHEVDIKGFNPNVQLLHGLKSEHIYSAMKGFTDFLGFINNQLHTKELERLEVMLMPANFSSMVGEFMSSSIPKYCDTLVKNQYHNGHPDIIVKGKFEGDSVQHADEGYEIKASRYLKGWQGHNPEDTWLMVFVFDSNRPTDASKGVECKPFKFLLVAGAELVKDDWLFAGRSEGSRRTITASIKKSGYDKMMSNWIYKAPDATKEEIIQTTKEIAVALPLEH